MDKGGGGKRHDQKRSSWSHWGGGGVNLGVVYEGEVGTVDGSGEGIEEQIKGKGEREKYD